MLGTTPLGFYVIQQEEKMIFNCLLQKLQQPKIFWQSSKWRIFIIFASFSEDGFYVLNKESNNLIKEILLDLWTILDFDILSDSNIEMDNAVNQLMICVSSFSLSLKGRPMCYTYLRYYILSTNIVFSLRNY